MRNMKPLVALVIVAVLVMASNACKQNKTEVNIWDSAVYTEDTTFGEGEKSFFAEVKAGEKSVTFTINTDKENLEEALKEHELIDGEEGPYGMYIKKVNGITADYDVDQSYWSLMQNGTPLATGASGAEIKGGEHFEFIHTK